MFTYILVLFYLRLLTICVLSYLRLLTICVLSYLRLLTVSYLRLLTVRNPSDVKNENDYVITCTIRQQPTIYFTLKTKTLRHQLYGTPTTTHSFYVKSRANV